MSYSIEGKRIANVAPLTLSPYVLRFTFYVLRTLYPVVVRPARPPGKPPASPPPQVSKRKSGLVGRIGVRLPRFRTPAPLPRWVRPAIMPVLLLVLLVGIGWAI